MAAFIRKQYAGAAAPTTTTSVLTDVGTSVTIASTTGWPSLEGIPFYVVIEPGSANEEKCLATRSGSTLTLTRAQDDTTAVAHNSGSSIYPVFTANDADEANEVASKLTTKGDILVTDGSGLYRLAVGTNGYFLKANSAAAYGVEWGSIPTINSLDDVGDVTISSVEGGDFLVYNSSASVWNNETIHFITVSDSIPTDEVAEGDLWYDSLTLELFIRAANAWIQLTDDSMPDLGLLNDVYLTDTTAGDVLTFNGNEWENAALQVALGTNTTGNYMTNIVGGTGVTVIHTPGEGSTASVSVGQDVGTSSSVTFAQVTAPLTGSVTGNASTASALQTARTIALTGDVAGSVSFDGSASVAISTTIQPNSITLGTDTAGNYVSDVVGGTGITVSHTPGEGSSASIAIGQDVSTSSSVTFAKLTTSGDVVVGGNLTVDGTTTTINTENLLIEDNSIILNSKATGAPVANAGIEIERGSSTNVEMRWNESTDRWQFTNDGTTYNDVLLLSDITQNGLNDTVITNPLLKQSLVYDGTNWVNQYAAVTTYARNAEPDALAVGEVVYLFGAAGDRASVKRASNSAESTSSKTVGVVEVGGASGADVTVVTNGYVSGISLGAYNAGDVLWLGSTAGTFTATKPTAPNHLVFIGVVARANNGNGILYVKCQNGYEIEELHDVQINTATLTSGDFLKYNGTVWVNDPINLGTDTTGNYMSDVSAGTGISITHTPGEGSTATITNAGVTSVNGSSGAITGVVRTSDTGTVTSTMLADGTVMNIDINASAGIAHSKLADASPGQVLLGTTTTGVITATALSGDVTITGGGVTSIGSGVIVNADISAAAAISHSKLASLTSGNILVGNGSNVPTAVAVTGDVTISNAGVTAIGAGVIVNADINSSAAIAHSKLANATAGQVLLGTTTTGVVTATTVSGDVTIDGAGVTAIGSGVIVNADINASAAIDKTKISGTAITAADTGTVTSTMIADGTIVNADINASAAIALSKLASGTSGQIIVANASGVPAWVSESGDISIDANGVTAIASGVIVNADISSSAAIDASKITTWENDQVILSGQIFS